MLLRHRRFDADLDEEMRLHRELQRALLEKEEDLGDLLNPSSDGVAMNRAERHDLED